MAGKPRTRASDADDAESRAADIHAQILQCAPGGDLLAWRAEAIRQALAKGSTLRRLAKVLGVSPQTVRKMREAGHSDG